MLPARSTSSQKHVDDKGCSFHSPHPPPPSPPQKSDVCGAAYLDLLATNLDTENAVHLEKNPPHVNFLALQSLQLQLLHPALLLWAPALALLAPQTVRTGCLKPKVQGPSLNTFWTMGLIRVSNVEPIALPKGHPWIAGPSGLWVKTWDGQTPQGCEWIVRGMMYLAKDCLISLFRNLCVEISPSWDSAHTHPAAWLLDLKCSKSHSTTVDRQLPGLG